MIIKTRIPVSRPRNPSLNIETGTETANLAVSVTRPRPRLWILESQWLDRDQEYWSQGSDWDRDNTRNNLWWFMAKSKAFNGNESLVPDLFLICSDGSKILLIIYIIYWHWIQDFLRPEIFRDVETKTLWGCRDRLLPRLRKSCPDWDFIKILTNYWVKQ